MTREEKNKIILDLYKKRLSFLKGKIDEDSYFSYVDNDTVDKLCTNKNGYKDLNSKLKAVKTFINNYFRSNPSLENIDKIKELKELEKEYDHKQKEKELIDKDKNIEYIYNSYINYSKGIGSDYDDNENIFIDILDNFNYKSVDIDTKISNKNALSTRFDFFREKACNYYVKTFNKKRVEFFKYINSLEESKKIKYLKKERQEEDTLSELRELLYTEYIKYLNDLTTETKLVNFAKKNNINLFTKMLIYAKSNEFDSLIVHQRHEENKNNYEDLEMYREIYLDEALEFCDIIFNNNLDKIYFLRQYLKSLQVYDGKDKYIKGKILTKR